MSREPANETDGPSSEQLDTGGSIGAYTAARIVGDTTSTDRVVAITVDGELVHFATGNEYEYTLIDAPSHARLTVDSIKAALIDRMAGIDDGSRYHARLNDDPLEPIAGLTLYAPSVWEDQAMIMLYLHEEDYCEAAFWFMSMRKLSADDLEHIVTSEFNRHDGELGRLTPVGDLDSIPDEIDGPSRSWQAIGVLPTDLRLAEILQIQNDLSFAVIYSRGGPTSARQVVELLRLGGAGRLIGMRESDWLEAKRPPYEMRGEKDEWKLELLLDVTSFANSDQGGVIVVGVATKNIGGSDIVVKLHPLPRNPGRAQRYHDVLSAGAAPLIDGLLIESHEHEDGDLVTILIPPQREELKPFVADGGVAGSRHSGRLFSVVQRRGEGTTVASLHEVQATLATGRAFLRGQGREGQARH